MELVVECLLKVDEPRTTARWEAVSSEDFAAVWKHLWTPGQCSV